VNAFLIPEPRADWKRFSTIISAAPGVGAGWTAPGSCLIVLLDRACRRIPHRKRRDIMAGERFHEVIKDWEGGQVVIINPESFSVSKLGVKTSLEHYEATLVKVTSEYLQFGFQYQKEGQDQPVEQYIPIGWVKRASVWGTQRYIQL
jgi:hypothetical protein